jgi:hypothetical protein
MEIRLGRSLIMIASQQPYCALASLRPPVLRLFYKRVDVRVPFIFSISSVRGHFCFAVFLPVSFFFVVTLGGFALEVL